MPKKATKRQICSVEEVITERVSSQPQSTEVLVEKGNDMEIFSRPFSQTCPCRSQKKKDELEKPSVFAAFS